MFVMWIICNEIEVGIKLLENWGYFLVNTLLNKNSWIVLVVLKRTDR